MRHAMVALTSFAIDGELAEQLAFKHPHFSTTGVGQVSIKQGAEFWSDDAIVQAYPSFFADRSIAPTAGESPDDVAAGRGQPEQARPPASAADPGYGLQGLTREAILTAKRGHDAEGHNSMAMHKRLHTTARTLMRARHHYRLVPWPDD